MKFSCCLADFMFADRRPMTVPFHLRAGVSSCTERAVQGVEVFQLPVDSLGDTRGRELHAM